ncbi:MAG TPA: acyl-CoA synthetase FdrA [Solirubrobacter sp.]|nr:acyl-CoA synthetase FdrA [Solirubrobacter sp.]
MAQGCALERDTYFDSVMLMGVAARLNERAGVRSASLMMGTETNKRLLRDAGLLTAEGEAASANDLIIAVDGEDVDAALADARRLLAADDTPGGEPEAAARPRSLVQAVAEQAADVALISTPGAYAAAEALKAVRLGLHVFLFSDNVSVEDEIALKRAGRERGRLVMGPDCGTAIIDGVGLGFANAVRPGAIGLIGASGTGTQQVSTLIDAAGLGISQAIGVGGRDLSEAVGGASMLQALEILEADPATEVIVLISKPAAPAVADRVLERAAATGKPVVACFIGAQGDDVAGTLEDAARAAVELAGGDWPVAETARPAAARGGVLRALFAGGTFAYEAQALLAERPVAHALDGYAPGRPVTLPGTDLVLDLGDDEYTVGRPHPMIDPSTRVEVLEAALADERTGAILLDVVLGYGASDDPAEPLAAAIEQAADAPPVVAFVVGTDADPQDRAGQERRLRDAGAVVAPSSTAAIRLAIDLVTGAPLHA